MFCICIKDYHHLKRYHTNKQKRISEFIVDDTMLKVGLEHIWVWIAIEPEKTSIPSHQISQKRETRLLPNAFCQT
ncbi:MAG: hypothetical protein AB7U98_00125 [Candidatus Nitrosocosmicus sp.]